MPEHKHRELTTLLDLLPIMEERGRAEAIRYNNGYRTFVWSYDRLLEAVSGCAAYFSRSGLVPGDRVLLWGENRPEWIAAFWAAVSRGLEVVPVDPAASIGHLQSIQSRTEPGMLVCSETMSSKEIDLQRLRFHELGRLPSAGPIDPVKAHPDDTVEIVFTSGTTGDPKGIVHTHKNICADLRPLDKEIRSLRTYLRFLQPVRALSILPLSHMFGQALGLFVPVLLGGSIVLSSELNPKRLMQLIRKEKAAALVTVPGQLESLQRTLESSHDCTRRMKDSPGVWGFFRRWLRFFDVHRRFGLKFVALVVGGAQLRQATEHWWSQLGFVVVQGYGLTEASPVVAMNNPLKVKAGSLGTVQGGQSVKIADDGEILVRGDNVARYFGQEVEAGEDEWLPTGDIGRIDEEGNLYFLGRKKDVIVTPDGQNVYPEDVEPQLEELPEVDACAVVGKETERGAEVHAVLILADPEASPGALVKKANAGLESHQRIRSWSLWPESDFPRTPSTGKVKRNQVAKAVNQSSGDQPVPQAGDSGLSPLQGILSQFTSMDPEEIKDEHSLSHDLGLSSLDRVELLTALEEDMGLDLDEDALATVTTFGDLKAITKSKGPKKPGPSQPRDSIQERTGREAELRPEPADQPRQESRAQARPEPQQLPRLELPRWSRRFPSRSVRFLFQEILLIPASRLYLRLSVSGLDNLEQLRPPVMFAANHTSHLDTLAILAALPSSWRRRVAPAMLQEYFTPLLEPDRYGLHRRIVSRTIYILLCHLLQAYPLPQKTGGIRQAIRFTGELAEYGNCPLIYPEGQRTLDGQMNDFQSGAGVMAKWLDLPVVPVHVQGLFELFSIHQAWPRPGRCRVAFGQPLVPSPDVDARTFTAKLRGRVASLV